MNHIVSLSGGTASAVAADRVIQKYGTAVLWFADTSWEDEDLYRFLDDCESRWNIPIIKYRDGRTPLEVAEDASIIPNQRRAPCTLALKIEPFVRHLQSMPKPVTVHLGLDWSEVHRMERPKQRYEEFAGVSVDFPLMWKPYETDSYHDVVESWGIRAPRLYRMGFPHNNCGGRCVKQGLKEWMRLREYFPERFTEVQDWELAQRDKGGARANYAIARDQSGGTVTPLTLKELSERNQPVERQMVQEDMFACFCSY